MNLPVFWLPLSFTYLREKKHSSYLLDVVASAFKKCEFQGDAVWHPYIFKVKLLTVSHMYLPLNFDNSMTMDYDLASRRKVCKFCVSYTDKYTIQSSTPPVFICLWLHNSKNSHVFVHIFS
jgi:hypothetical protein